ncbi:MAG: hypothetical protein ABWX96_13995, partial [Propionibacteriaceae bacterium]
MTLVNSGTWLGRTRQVPATPSSDADAAQAFAARMIDVINDASIAHLISIGHQTRLFETLAARSGATDADLAAAAALDEHCVREWLNGLTVAGVLEYEPARRRYTL